MTDLITSSMRKIRPAYKKVLSIIRSCKTLDQLITANSCIVHFHTLFPFADKFTARLYTELFNHEFDDAIIEMIQDNTIQTI